MTRKIPSARSSSVTRTLRLDPDLLQMLEEISRDGNVSVNSLVTRVLRRYAEWEVYAEKLGVIGFSGSALEKLFDSLSEEEARALGRDNGNDGGTDLITFMFKKFDYESLLRMAELFGQGYGRLYTFVKGSDGDTDTLIFKHNKGPNMSAYLSESMKTMLARLERKHEVLETESQVTIKVLPARSTNSMERSQEQISAGFAGP